MITEMNDHTMPPHFVLGTHVLLIKESFGRRYDFEVYDLVGGDVGFWFVLKIGERKRVTCPLPRTFGPLEYLCRAR